MGLVLLFVSLAGSVAALTLAAVGTAALLGRKGRPLRGLALVAAAGAVAVYVCGLGPVGLDAPDAGSGGTDSVPPHPCRTGPRERRMQVVGWEAGFVPVRFECRLADGGSYRNGSVPGWVNPAAAVLGPADAVRLVVPLVGVRDGEHVPGPDVGLAGLAELGGRPELVGGEGPAAPLGDAAGAPLEQVRTLYRGDRFSFTLDLPAPTTG